MDLTDVIVLLAAGFGSGFINSVAGGGSALTLPVLTELVGASTANGTNRIGILIGNLSSLYAYSKGGAMRWEETKGLIPPVVVGAAAGSIVASQLPADAMQRFFAIALVIVVLSVVLKPNRWLEGAEARLHQPWTGIVFFLVGFYGGFVQAGVGFFLLAAMVFGAGFQLVEANGAKVLLITSFTWISLMVFAIAGQVDIVLGLVLAVGQAAGGYVSARVALKRGAGWVRWLLIIAALVAAVRMATS